MRDRILPPPAGTPAFLTPAAPDEFLEWGHVTGLLRRHWIMVAAAVALALGIALAYLAVTPKRYEDTATLLIEKEQYNLPEIVTHEATDLGLVSTEVELLHSERVSQQVAAALALNVTVHGSRLPRSALLAKVGVVDSAATAEIALDRQPDGRFVAHNETTGQTSAPFAAGAPVIFGPVSFTLTPAATRLKHLQLDVEPVALAATQLQADAKVGRGDRDANTIWVRYRSTDPVLATAVPHLLAQYYLANRIDGAKAKVRTAVAFLQQQADTLQKQLLAADQQLHDFRQRDGVVSLADEAASAVSQQGQLRITRGSTEAERAALQQLVTSADTSPSAFRRITAFPTLIGNPTVSNLLHSLDDLEGQRTELLLRRTPRDPDVQALDRRIQADDAQLRGLTLTYLSGLHQQVAALDKSLAAQSAIAASIPGKSMTEDELSRRPKVLGDVYGLVETRLQEARIAETVADPGVSIIDPASGAGMPVWPRRGLILAVALLGGLLVGVVAAWLRDGMDSAVHSRADVARAVELPVLTVVPHIRSMYATEGVADTSLLAATPMVLSLPSASGRARRKHSGQLAAAGAVEEAYTWLETSLAFAERSEELHIVAVTSPLAREGKTVTASNLAISAARHGRRVLMVDGDLRRGHVHDLFALEMSPGLSDALVGSIAIRRAIQTVPVGHGATLDVLPRGGRAHQPAALLKSPAFRTILGGLESAYDLIVIDCPPVNLVSDPLVIAQVADGVVLVARAGITDTAALTQAGQHLRDAGAPLLGVILNDINLHRDGSYDESYQYLDQAGAYATSDT